MKFNSKKFWQIFTFIFIIIIVITIIGVCFVWSKYNKELSLAWSFQRQGETTYLIVFQNSLELRPTGGFIGNFAEVTFDGIRLKNYTIYNTNAFDYGKPGIDSPQPFKDMLGIDQVQLRDSNWSPDFPTTAQKIIELYKLEGGVQNVSGVIAVNSSVLQEALKVTGTIYLDSIGKSLDYSNVLLELQYELNFGFAEKGISRSDRKEPIKDLASEIENRLKKYSWRQFYRFGNMLLSQADQKQVLLWSNNPNVQNKIIKLGWDGMVDQNVEGDYFMLVDSNLGALKTDYYMQRVISKDITNCSDDSSKLCSQLVIKYINSAKLATPLNNDYKSYTRVLLPKEAFVTKVQGIEPRIEPVDYSYNYDKKVVGFEIMIPFNSSKEIILDYTIPKPDIYNLSIQKQSGIKGFDFTFNYKISNLSESLFIDSDWIWKNK